MAAIYVTGDKHGRMQSFSDASNIVYLSELPNKYQETILIVTGDAGLNYYLDSSDRKRKKYWTDNYPHITLFCIHGNHEARPQTIPSYKTKRWHNGLVYYEEEFPNILFAIDGFVYDLNGYKCLVAGGAYSVDKYYRLDHGYAWFPDEQMNTATKDNIRQCMNIIGWKVDVVFSHTCPLSQEPKEMYIGSIDQSTVDKSTEIFLDELYHKLQFRKWYCGHWHCDKKKGKIQFLYNRVINMDDDLTKDLDYPWLDC